FSRDWSSDVCSSDLVNKKEDTDLIEPQLKRDVQPPLFTEPSFENPIFSEEIEEEEIQSEIETQNDEDFPQTIMFSLDDDFEEGEINSSERTSLAPQTKAEVRQEVKKEITHDDPFDSPISQ